MPAIQVARTDTFEQQRIKINEIGSRLFDVTGGGSDLSTGNLKLGDGTITEPSLAFNTNPTLGFYKSSLTGFSIASSEKKVISFSDEAVISFKDFIVRQQKLITNNTTIQSPGSGYDTSVFNNVPLIGGSGLNGTANITVIEYDGTITNTGYGYNPGSFSSIPLINGSGSGATVSFEVDGVSGVITNAGSGYVGGQYPDVSLTTVTGSGINAVADIEVVDGSVVSVQITNNGSGYNAGDVLSASSADLGGSGSNFRFTITSQPFKITSIDFDERGTGYQSGDVLSFAGNGPSFTGIAIGSSITETVTLSTATAQITIPDTSGIIQGASVFQYNAGGDTGAIPSGVTVQTIDSATELTLSALPTADGDAVLTFISNEPSQIQVPSLTGINDGDYITQTGGTGVLGSGVFVVGTDTEDNLVFLSQDTLEAGNANIVFGPPMGDPADDFSFTVGDLGVVDYVEIADGGNGYSAGDVLTVNPVDLIVPTTYVVTVDFLQDITLNGTISASAISVGDFVINPAGAITGFNQSSSTDIPGQANQTYEVTGTPGLSGSGAIFRVTRDENGEANEIVLVSGGSGYEANDIFTISGSDVGGSAGPDNIILNITDVLAEDGSPIEVLVVNTSGSNISSITVKTDQFVSGTSFVIEGTSNPIFSVATASEFYERFFIDDQLTPDITLYSGDRYVFDISTVASHVFSFSEFRDGDSSPSLIENVTTTLTALSNSFVVDDATGILVGMLVSTISGVGGVAPNTKVTNVSGTTITVDQPATLSGLTILRFSGYEYTQGVTRTNTTLEILVSDSTPDLYYYCSLPGIDNENIGGSDGIEGLLTTDNNNPRVFGSGAEFLITGIASADIITNDIETGSLSVVSTSGSSLNFTTGNITTLGSTDLTSTNVTATNITSTSDLNINTSGATKIVTGNFNIGSTIQITSGTGVISSSGDIKTTSKFISNEKLEISENKISTVPGQQLLIEPGGQSELVKVVSTSALVIPAGDNNQRPADINSSNGAIRFNTITNQYEGYSENSSSWSSLGGVRDLDGNTLILAEETVGANDNTLWFINDNVNTIRISPTHQEFVNVKKIRSVNVSAPSYEEWRANAPVALGDYLKYRNNIYEVTLAGTTATSGNEPTHTSGSETNGTAVLQYLTTAVANLTFEEISELRIDPLGFTPLVVNNELKLSKNIFSSITNDIIIRPAAGQKVVINSPTSLVIPVGDNNSKGNPTTGSIRYNTADLTFEGFDGTSWGSLGGVRDIDRDTYIVPELTPGGDQDTLYFYNANNNTLQLNSSALDFYSIDTVNSQTSDTLNVNASTITFDNLATTLDNTSTTTTFLFTTKENFDLGLSSGLTTDPLLRLTDTGDIFYNLGFGSGVYNAIKIFDSELKELEIADYKIVTKKVNLERGILNSGDAVVYNPASEKSAKVTLTAHNVSTGDKEFIEYSVVDNGVDIFFSEIGNISTGVEQIESLFDFNAGGEVRISFTLNTALTSGNDVEVTVVSHITKR